MTGQLSARAVAEMLGLAPLQHEGGLYRQTYADACSTAIYYLLAEGDFSALHRLAADEIYHYYAGAALSLLLLRPDGGIDTPVLGPDLAAGQRPQLLVPAGTWQGSCSTGDWTLIGTTMAPPFDWAGFELGARAELIRAYPAAAERITGLTRAG